VQDLVWIMGGILVYERMMPLKLQKFQLVWLFLMN